VGEAGASVEHILPSVSTDAGAPASPRVAGTLPFPNLAPGTTNGEMPFDRIVVVMMENHSFDNLLGELSRTRTDVEGLEFDGAGEATNSNPSRSGGPSDVRAKRLADTSQAKHITQTWRATHEQINNGAMDGFVGSEHGQAEAMGFYPPGVLPFAYSLANTYTLANQWFCSTPGPTYPNRRFLMAGTAFGGTTSGPAEILNAFEKPPANGTIFDLLSKHNISWANYSRDIPMTLVFPRVLLEHFHHHHRFTRFLADCAANTLPQVSFVDPKMGTLSAIGNALVQIPEEVKLFLDRLDPGETDEDPDNMYYGERWAHKAIEAVVRSPGWSRTLLIYTFDEHGGYYDHVPPPAAIAPDDIPPAESPGDYRTYGPRVPAVVVSPYAIPGGTSNVIHDHTSILATIEHKWNLPALTNRDANAETVMDMLDATQPPRLDPPLLTEPSATGPSGPLSQGPAAVKSEAKLAPSPPRSRIAEPDGDNDGGAGMKRKIASDPVERWEKLVAMSAPPSASLKPETLEGVIADGGDEVAALSRHVAEHSSLSLAQAKPLVKAAIEKSAEEGKADPKAKAEAVSKATAGLTGATANVELSDPVMLEPIFRVIFGGFLAAMFAGCILCLTIIGNETSTQESALIGLAVLGVLALVGVLVLVMGYKNVKITGAGPSAGTGS
jgi:phospholipase C